MMLTEQDIALIYNAVMGGETGDSSSQINVAQDFAGSIFDPAIGFLADAAGQGGPGGAIDWGQLFEFETPEPAPVAPQALQWMDSFESDDDVEQMVYEMAAAGASASAIERAVINAMPLSEDGGKDEESLRKTYMTLGSELVKERTEYEGKLAEYNTAAQNYDGTPKLVETELVEKFRKAGIPLPTERPEYTASDFSPGAAERSAAVDSAGQASVQNQQDLANLYEQRRAARRGMGDAETRTSQNSRYQATPGQGGNPEAVERALEYGGRQGGGNVGQGGRMAQEATRTIDPDWQRQMEAGMLPADATPQYITTGIDQSLIDSILQGDQPELGEVDSSNREQFTNSANSRQRGRSRQGSTPQPQQQQSSRGRFTAALNSIDPEMRQILDQQSQFTKARRAPQTIDEWRAYKADRRAANTAKNYTAAGRTPTVDAMLARLGILGGR